MAAKLTHKKRTVGHLVQLVDRVAVGNQVYTIGPVEHLTDGNGDPAFAVVNLTDAEIYYDPNHPVDVVNDSIWHEVFEIMTKHSCLLQRVDHDQLDLFAEKTAFVATQLGGRFVIGKGSEE